MSDIVEKLESIEASNMKDALALDEAILAIITLQSENERLREALTESHDAMMEVSGTRNEAARIVSGAIHAARAAMGGKP